MYLCTHPTTLKRTSNFQTRKVVPNLYLTMHSSLRWHYDYKLDYHTQSFSKVLNCFNIFKNETFFENLKHEVHPLYIRERFQVMFKSITPFDI